MVVPAMPIVVDWRSGVHGCAGGAACDYSTLRAIEVQIDSEMLSKTDKGKALLLLAADLQQHRRLPGLDKDVSKLLDEKAKAIGKLASTVMQGDLVMQMMNNMRTAPLFMRSRGHRKARL
mmetsp:Transcript_110369/g.318981  ORF Transcript_110369/g.318981 Transcript_110369/m.318981 type:complete len:120 (-) Transcript_110369:91-450(-)